MFPDQVITNLCQSPAPPMASILFRPGIPVALTIILCLLAFLFLQHRWHRQTIAREKKRHELEKRISEFAERLAATPASAVDATISEGLKNIVELLEADRLCWYEVAEDSSMLLHKYTGSVRQAVASPKVIPPEKMPYMGQRLGKHERVMLRGLEDLPAAGRRDREFLQSLGVKSLLLIPSRYSPTRNGVLGLASYCKVENWADEIGSELAIVANVIGATLERKYEQIAREESEQRFRYLFAQASVGIALETLEGRILEVNPAFCGMLGYAAEELKRLRCERISHPDDEEIEKVLFEELRQGLRTSYSIEKRFFRKDGSEIWGQVNVSLLSLHPESAPLVLGMVSDCTAQKTAEAALYQRDQELQRLAGHLIEAQEEERRRISRELHDDIGQRVALLACELDRERLVENDRRDRDGLALRTELDAIATDIHKLSHELHSASLQTCGLKVALRDLCRKYEAHHHLEIELQSDGLDCRLAPEVALCLYRVAQESLANALKHARTDRITVSVTRDGERVRLAVKDFGLGFDSTLQVGGIGLTSMRERLRLCGGTLSVNTAINSGTEIAAEVPAPVQVAAAGA